MEFIDENGNLFGRINVVDVLVVLVLLAVVLAGAALVLNQEPEPTTATVNATLDLGTQPGFIVDAIEEGDSYSPTDLAALTITDVFTTPTDDGTRVLARVRLTGEKEGGSISYDGGPPRLGRSLSIVTAQYELSGQIRALGGGGTLTQRQTTVVIRDRLSRSDAAAVEPGDTVELSGRSVATVQNVTLHPTDDPATRLAFLTVELQTVVRDGVPQFGTGAVRDGRSIRFSTPAYTVDGTVQRVGERVTTRDRTVVVRQRIDAADTAEYTPGSEIQINGQTALTVQNRTLQPTGDPTQHVAYLTLNLTTVTRQGDSRFAGQTLRRGGGLTVAGDDLRIDGRITALDDTPTVSEQSVVLRTRTAASRARQIAPGDSVTLGRQTVATVDNVSVYSTSDPDERVVFLEASLTAVERGGDFQFGGTPVRRGQNLSLDTGAYTVTGRIDSLDSGLAREQTAVLIRDTVDTDTATELTVGDRALVAGQSTATVRNVTVYGTNDPDRKRVAVGLSLQTVDYGEQPQFGGSFVREGNGITLRTEEYTLSGAIERVGTTAQRGTPTTRTVTLRLDEVRSDLAQAITEGMTERSGDTVLAEVTNVSREPSTILIRGDRGDLGVFDHPTLRDVTITADLRVRETSDGVRFKGETIQQGGSVTLDLGTVTVEVTVVRIGS